MLNQKGGFYNSAFLLLHTEGSFDAEPVRVNPTPDKAIDPAQLRPVSNDVNSRERYVINGFAVNDFGEICIITDTASQ
ncbi:MAG TPA: hypothetical protein VN687_13990 [Blastocatellia bacterium]|nr:hypothetical protein [Blastocatellia bacterium]